MALGKMDIWTNFPRKNDETLRKYRQRHTRIVASLQKSGVAIPPNIVFRNELYAAKLNSSQISLSIGAFESQHLEETLKDLKRLSVKLFGRNFLENGDRIVKVDEMFDGGASSSGSGVINDGSVDVPIEPLIADECECFAIKKVSIPM